MRFAIIGGDRRQIETSLFLNSKNHSVVTYGLPKIKGINETANDFNILADCDAMILPLPITKDNTTINSPLIDKDIYISDILQLKPKFIFGGMISDNLCDVFESKKIDYYDYYKSEKLTVKNAVLTAEAAVSIAIQNCDRSIYNSKSLVIGYGRIGKQLAKYLNTLGSEVTATSRNEETLVNIEIDGITPLKTDEILDFVSNFDFIFNTIPAPILNSDFFANCKPTVFVEDLATNSGVSLNEAKKFGINADIYGGLPGKYSPITAAEFITNEILNKCKSVKFKS